ncbi:putative dehydrogenase [Burkholderiales bacterium JOSHI_001]|nr:putative dehydrogenase [Burkholderiales bacterium JOSHI_001]
MVEERVDAVVIGAGVVGLAVARALARAGREVWLLDKADAFGTETSARNSEVIHAGLYYPPGSLRARLCVQGKALLYDYCAQHGVAHRRCGKLLVATHEDQHPKLDALKAQAEANGVHDLQWLGADEARALEPALRCTRALLSPSTGIVDSHGLMLALLGDAEAAGAQFVARAPVVAGEVTGQGITLQVGGAEPLCLRASTVVNSAGLWAPQVAASIAGLAARHVPQARYCKGNYFLYSGKPAFQRLIYPLPEAAGLGVHVTLDLGGQMRFGPDTEWVTDIGDPVDYRVDPARGAAMVAAIRRYWPGLPDGALAPGYAGMRPKLHGPGEPAADFHLQGPAEHGVPGLVNLFGVESPGLTSCLAIADAVLALLGD